MAKRNEKIINSIEIKGVSKEKKEALNKVISDIEKKYGKGSVMLLGEKNFEDVEVVSTGSIGLDFALGVGGVPKGRIIEIYGNESSGKTTLALQICAEAQKKGGEVAFLDVEHSLDPEYAKVLGVDINRLIVSQPDTGEQCLEIAEVLVRSGGVDIIVIDSAAALVSKAEIDGDMGDSHVGLLARLLSQGMRKIVGAAKKNNCTIIFTNQLRESISKQMFVKREVTPGGRALKFYSSVRLEVQKIDSIKDGANILGSRTRVRVVKNKVAPPFKYTDFNILYGVGVDRIGELIEIGEKNGVIRKAGAWYSMGEERLGQGLENAKQYLKENLEVLKKLESEIYGLKGVDVEEKNEKEDILDEVVYSDESN